MIERDISQVLIEQILEAREQQQPLYVMGNNSKCHLGRDIIANPLSVGEHQGIVHYDPRELVLTARAGTSLSDIESTLDEAGQMLAFEPPHFGDATLGGTIAAGLSGPRRPFAGAGRDFVLGCLVLNGEGERMQFGGQVMKNVAGYDVSRLMAGSYGTLGVLLEVSLKVLPKPMASTTLFHECSIDEALTIMSQLRNKALPVDAAAYYKGQLYLRVSGSEQGVAAAVTKIAGQVLNSQSQFWQRLKEQQLSFFGRHHNLWRVMVKPATPKLNIAGEWLVDWGGAQRWLHSDESAAVIRAKVTEAGGHATLFRGGDRKGEIFQPLPPAMLALQQRIKHSFDPAGIFNPGRMYAEI